LSPLLFFYSPKVIQNPSPVEFLLPEATVLGKTRCPGRNFCLGLSYFDTRAQDNLIVSAIDWHEIFHEAFCFFMTGCFLL